MRICNLSPQKSNTCRKLLGFPLKRTIKIFLSVANIFMRICNLWEQSLLQAENFSSRPPHHWSNLYEKVGPGKSLDAISEGKLFKTIKWVTMALKTIFMAEAMSVQNLPVFPG